MENYEMVKIKKSDYEELLKYRRMDINEKTYKKNYYKNKYANDPEYRMRRKIANKKYQEKIKEKKRLEKINNLEK